MVESREKSIGYSPCTVRNAYVLKQTTYATEDVEYLNTALKYEQMRSLDR